MSEIKNIEIEMQKYEKLFLFLLFEKETYAFGTKTNLTK